MEINVIKKMLLAGSKNILENKQTLNDMNVFPIPDGDTGTNMDKTMSGIVKVLIEIGDRDLKPEDFDALYKSALMNSQGNSGVILSQWLKGFLKALRSETELDPGNLDAAFISGTQSAYSSVAEPVEGTFLTVCREAQEEAEDVFDEDTTVKDFMKNIVEGASESLKHTPEKLPILKEYDVLDSGGCGFLCLVRFLLALIIIDTFSNAHSAALCLGFCVCSASVCQQHRCHTQSRQPISHSPHNTSCPLFAVFFSIR